jgi:hypothetical protein
MFSYSCLLSFSSSNRSYAVKQIWATFFMAIIHMILSIVAAPYAIDFLRYELYDG